MLPTPALLTSADGCAVADCVWCTPGLALVQELQCEFPMPAFFTGTDGCIVANGIWCTPSFAFIQELQREFPTSTFFTGVLSLICTVTILAGQSGINRILILKSTI